uniref:Uncharacterized protein n=1 Tax=Timema cristinae TaxID=61476 RepID=A0A7R9HBN5_TIMCR|nr:unnamed protein product [Timema cristinae]
MPHVNSWYESPHGSLVIVETVEDGHTRSQHFTVDTLSEGSILRSLVLAVDQTQPGSHVTLYVDCVSQGMVATPRDLRDMFTNMAQPMLQVFRERRYVLEVDGAGGLSSVLNRNNCPSNIMQAIQPATVIDINSIHRIHGVGRSSFVIRGNTEYETLLMAA